MSAFFTASLSGDIQRWIYDASEVLLYPVLAALLIGLVWVLIETGWLLYELSLRLRFRDLEALEIRALRARQAFLAGKPRKAYRYLQENRSSQVLNRFIFQLIRNYQTERLGVKPLKLLQEVEFDTVRRLERTRILLRLGPIVGFMGALIPLAPALTGLSDGDVQGLTDNLVTSFGAAVLGLLIGALAYVVTLVRDRMYSQDVSDMEYLLELLEGGGRRLAPAPRRGAPPSPDDEGPLFSDHEGEAPAATVMPSGLGTPSSTGPEVAASHARREAPPPLPVDLESEMARTLAFSDPDEGWLAEDDPFADLGPMEDVGPARPPARR